MNKHTKATFNPKKYWVKLKSGYLLNDKITRFSIIMQFIGILIAEEVVKSLKYYLNSFIFFE